VTDFAELSSNLLVLHEEVHRLLFAAMMPGLRPAQVKRLKRKSVPPGMSEDESVES
jgi:hypothetical protein